MIICGISNINEEVANSFFEWWVDKSNPSADLQKRMTVILRRLEQMISGDVIDYSLPRKIPLSLPGHIQLSIRSLSPAAMGNSILSWVLL